MNLSSGQLGLAMLIITMVIVLASSLFLLSGLLPSSTTSPSVQTTTSFPPPHTTNTTTSGETLSTVSRTISTSYVTLTTTTSLTSSSFSTTTKTIIENQTVGSTVTITERTTITSTSIATETTTVKQKIYASKTILLCNPDLLRLGQKTKCTSITTSPSAPTGQVTFSSVGSVAGIFSRVSCQTASYTTGTLKCSVVYTPTQFKGREGVLIIWASYSGSSKVSPSRGNDVLLVLRLQNSFSLANGPLPILGEGFTRLPQLYTVLGLLVPLGYSSVPLRAKRSNFA